MPHVVRLLGWLCLLLPPVLPAMELRISQEGKENSGEYQVVGRVEVFEVATLGVAEFATQLRRGGLTQGALLRREGVNTFFAQTREGLMLLQLFDSAWDQSGGSVHHLAQLLGATHPAQFLFYEQRPVLLQGAHSPAGPGDDSASMGPQGGQRLYSEHRWSAPYTDGVAIGPLRGPWRLYLALLQNHGLSSWQLFSADGATLPVRIGQHLRLRVEVVPEGCEGEVPEGVPLDQSCLSRNFDTIDEIDTPLFGDNAPTLQGLPQVNF